MLVPMVGPIQKPRLIQGEIMFTVDTLVDSIQAAQKQFVETFVKDEEIRDSINQFVDNQAECTRTVLTTVTEFGQSVAEQTTKTVKKATEYDWSKLAELTKNK
jgi:hypothetical protein